MGDELYEGDEDHKHSGAHYHRGPPRNRLKTRDCDKVNADGSGCKYGDACNFRHPEDPGFGETESVHAKKPYGKTSKASAVPGKATGHPKKDTGPKFKMPEGVTYSDMLNSLADVVKNHHVVSVVLDERQAILAGIRELLLTTKKVDLILYQEVKDK